MRHAIISLLLGSVLLISCSESPDEDMDDTPDNDENIVYHDVLNIVDGMDNTVETEGYLTPEFSRFATDKMDGAWVVQVQRPDRIPFVTRVKNDHSIEWIKTLGVTKSTPLGMIATDDGVIIFLRNSLLQKTILLKLDQEGNKLWEKSMDFIVQSFNADKVSITETTGGTILYAAESLIIEFDLNGNVVKSYNHGKSIDAAIEHNGAYYLFARNSSGLSYDIFKLDQSLNLTASINIEVVNQNQNLKGVHVSDDEEIIAFFNVDRGQEGMHNRIYYLTKDLVGTEVKKGVLSSDGLDYMFTELHRGSYKLPTGEYGFGIFRSRGNLGNQDLGYHMIAFGNDVRYGVPYFQTPIFGLGGIYNDGTRENTGIFTLGTTSALLSYPVSNLGDCAGSVTYKLSGLPNDDFVYSNPQVILEERSISTAIGTEVQLSDFTVRDNGSTFCVR